MFRDFTDVVVLHIKKMIASCIYHCLTVKTDKCDVGSLISNHNDSLAIYENK
jgi:hypothetical protein